MNGASTAHSIWVDRRVLVLAMWALRRAHTVFTWSVQTVKNSREQTTPS
jgi:hypothetical protein